MSFTNYNSNGKGLGFGSGQIYAVSVFNGTGVIDPGSLIDAAGETVTITVTGAAVGDYAMVAPGVDLQGIIVSAYVSAANTVSCRIQNETGGTINLDSSTWKAKVINDGL